MPIGAAHRGRRGEARKSHTPPHVPIKALRIVAGITLDVLATEIGQITGRKPARGTLSAIESGIRGASTEMLRAIEQAYALPSGMVTTDYDPRRPATESPVEEPES